MLTACLAHPAAVAPRALLVHVTLQWSEASARAHVAPSARSCPSALQLCEELLPLLPLHEVQPGTLSDILAPRPAHLGDDHLKVAAAEPGEGGV